MSNNCCGLLVGRLIIQNEPDATPRLTADEDVLRHRQMGHQVQFLVDHADAKLLGSSGIGDLDFFAFDEDAAGVLRIDTGEHFHERGFAGAVFAHQRVHLARAQVEPRLAEGMNAGKALLDPFHQDQDITHVRSSGKRPVGATLNDISIVQSRKRPNCTGEPNMCLMPTLPREHDTSRFTC